MPAGITSILGITYSGFLIYGANAVTLVCGAKEAKRLFGKPFLAREMFARKGSFWAICSTIFRIATPFFPQEMMNWKCIVTLPLIGPALVLSRFQIADHLFMIFPVVVSSKLPFLAAHRCIITAAGEHILLRYEM